MPCDATYVKWFAAAIAALLLASCGSMPIAPADLIVVAPRAVITRGQGVRNDFAVQH